MRILRPAEEHLAEHIEELERRQEGRRAYAAQLEALIARRELEIENLRARLEVR